MPEKFEISQDLPGLNLPNALNFEANRLGTFANGSHPVSPISLAREGFFSTGNQDEVECFNCGQRHSGWKPGQVPSQIHRQISPNCSLVGDNAGRADAEAVLPNIPIPQRNSRPALFTGRAFRSFAPKLGIQEFGDGHNDFNVYRPLPFPGVTLRVQPDLRAIHNATALIPQQAYGTLPFTAWVDPGPQEPPLYPGYSSALQRQNSFQRFPEALRWLVEQLIHHGFFFVGMIAKGF